MKHVAFLKLKKNAAGKSGFLIFDKKEYIELEIEFDGSDEHPQYEDQFYINKPGSTFGLWFLLEDLDFKDPNIEEKLKKELICQKIIE